MNRKGNIKTIADDIGHAMITKKCFLMSCCYITDLSRLLKYLKLGDYLGVCVTIRLHDTLKMTAYFYDVMTKHRIHGRIVI